MPRRRPSASGSVHSSRSLPVDRVEERGTGRGCDAAPPGDDHLPIAAVPQETLGIEDRRLPVRNSRGILTAQRQSSEGWDRGVFAASIPAHGICGRVARSRTADSEITSSTSSNRTHSEAGEARECEDGAETCRCATATTPQSVTPGGSLHGTPTIGCACEFCARLALRQAEMQQGYRDQIVETASAPGPGDYATSDMTESASDTNFSDSEGDNALDSRSREGEMEHDRFFGSPAGRVRGMWERTSLRNSKTAPDLSRTIRVAGRRGSAHTVDTVAEAEEENSAGRLTSHSEEADNERVRRDARKTSRKKRKQCYVCALVFCATAGAFWLGVEIWKSVAGHLADDVVAPSAGPGFSSLFGEEAEKEASEETETEDFSEFSETVTEEVSTPASEPPVEVESEVSPKKDEPQIVEPSTAARSSPAMRPVVRPIPGERPIRANSPRRPAWSPHQTPADRKMSARKRRRRSPRSGTPWQKLDSEVDWPHNWQPGLELPGHTGGAAKGAPPIRIFDFEGDKSKSSKAVVLPPIITKLSPTQLFEKLFRDGSFHKLDGAGTPWFAPTAEDPLAVDDAKINRVSTELADLQIPSGDQARTRWSQEQSAWIPTITAKRYWEANEIVHLGEKNCKEAPRQKQFSRATFLGCAMTKNHFGRGLSLSYDESQSETGEYDGALLEPRILDYQVLHNEIADKRGGVSVPGGAASSRRFYVDARHRAVKRPAAQGGGSEYRFSAQWVWSSSWNELNWMLRKLTLGAAPGVMQKDLRGVWESVRARVKEIEREMVKHGEL